jgi:hypothetical protein
VPRPEITAPVNKALRRIVKLYELRGTNLYKLSGELVGHLNNGLGTGNRLDKSTDKLFPRK